MAADTTKSAQPIFFEEVRFRSFVLSAFICEICAICVLLFDLQRCVTDPSVPRDDDYFIAITGSIRPARRAGTYAAPSATTRRSTLAPTNVTGSSGCT